jgi:hypothetical protein
LSDRRVRAHTAESTNPLYKKFDPVNGYTWALPKLRS